MALFERVQAVVDRRLDDPCFGVEELAGVVGMSRSTLHRRLVRITGRPPGQMIRETRLIRAAAMLGTTERDIAEIAADVGYTDPAHFTRSFKRYFGRTPTAHRASRGDSSKDRPSEPVIRRP